jgi:hypothetical protein
MDCHYGFNASHAQGDKRQFTKRTHSSLYRLSATCDDCNMGGRGEMLRPWCPPTTTSMESGTRATCPCVDGPICGAKRATAACRGSSAVPRGKWNLATSWIKYQKPTEHRDGTVTWAACIYSIDANGAFAFAKEPDLAREGTGSSFTPYPVAGSTTRTSPRQTPDRDASRRCR